jgi:hypothetical protein
MLKNDDFYRTNSSKMPLYFPPRYQIMVSDLDRGIRFTGVVEQGSRKKCSAFFTDIAFQPVATITVN